MPHSGLRLVAVIVGSVLAYLVVTDAQARRGHRSHGHHHVSGFTGRHGMGVAAPGTVHFARDHFAHNNPRGGAGFGWYGPVFWPYAYDDIFDDVLWGYGLGSPFWDYGYEDIYSVLFSPFGYNDLVPTEQPQETETAPPVSRAQNRQASRSTLISQMCGDDSREVAGWPTDRIEQSISPRAEQRSALDEFGAATIRAAQMVKDACPIGGVFTPTGRLEAMQKRIEGMVQGVTVVGPPLDRFYTSLTDEQKGRLNDANGQRERNRGSTAGCNAGGNAGQWPADQIEKAVQPSPEQQSKLNALRKAMHAASDDLADACPSSLPATPPARLKAISRRLDIMLKAVENVRPVLDDFYTSLSDEQKAQFDAIRRQRSARQ
jgi:hypothetical protein